MDIRLLNKALREIKVKLSLDYALNKGFMSPSCTTKMLEETYGIGASGIYVRWFSEDQGQPPIINLQKLYINHDLDKENYEFRKTEIVKILSKYYMVKWDSSMGKTILITEKEIKK